MGNYNIKTTSQQLTHSKELEKVCEEANEYVQEGIDYIKAFTKSLEIFSSENSIDLKEQIKINDNKNESRKNKKKVYLDDDEIIFLHALKNNLRICGLVIDSENISIILKRIEE